MYSPQIRKLRTHPYVDKIGALNSELRSLLWESGIDVLCLNSVQIHGGGIRGREIKKILVELKCSPSPGRGRSNRSPIRRSRYRLVYGSQPETRVQFELKEVQKEYDRMVEGGGNLMGFLMIKRVV